jgi:vacuolar-type H+-ATPase subunit H
VEKLERVLEAEERSRHLLTDARERAAARRAEASTLARLIAGERAEHATAEAVIERDRLLAEAEASAAEIATGAATQREATIAEARSRMDAAITSVVGVLRS